MTHAALKLHHLRSSALVQDAAAVEGGGQTAGAGALPAHQGIKAGAVVDTARTGRQVEPDKPRKDARRVFQAHGYTTLGMVAPADGGALPGAMGARRPPLTAEQQRREDLQVDWLISALRRSQETKRGPSYRDQVDERTFSIRHHCPMCGAKLRSGEED
jgi:hypothetical protein